MCARRVDGLIISPTPGPHDYLVSEIEAGVATVFVLRPPQLVDADAVLPDERGGAARRHRAPGRARAPERSGSSASPPGTGRGRCGPGTRKPWRRPGSRSIPAWLMPGRRGARARGRDRGVLRGPGADAGRACRAFAGRGDVAVVGFGDFELADLVSPPVTVVSYDPELIGRTAGEAAPPPTGRGPGTAPPGRGPGQADRPVRLGRPELRGGSADEHVHRRSRPGWRRRPR